MNQRQVVYILSTNFAGSHLLTLQLGSHSQCISLGEFHRFKRAGKKHKQACHICENDESCPLFSGISGLSPHQMHEHLFLNINNMNHNVHTAIDNSKKTIWAKRFLNTPGFKKKYIHIIRDPRALVRRWMVSYETNKEKMKERKHIARRYWQKSWNIMTGSEANVYIWKWLFQNQLITKFIQNYRLDARLVTYSDLVLYPDRILSELMNWIGVDYEPQQKEYWKFIHHGSVKSQYMQAPKDGLKTLDQRWKTFLDANTQRIIFEHPAVLEYLNKLNLHFDEDVGLVSKP